MGKYGGRLAVLLWIEEQRVLQHMFWPFILIMLQCIERRNNHLYAIYLRVSNISIKRKSYCQMICNYTWLEKHVIIAYLTPSRFHTQNYYKSRFKKKKACGPFILSKLWSRSCLHTCFNTCWCILTTFPFMLQDEHQTIGDQYSRMIFSDEYQLCVNFRVQEH